MSETKTYLVTGCAGFIASQVARLLLEQGQHVVGIDNMNDYYDVSLKQHRVDQLASDRFEFVKMDLENVDQVAQKAMLRSLQWGRSGEEVRR